MIIPVSGKIVCMTLRSRIILILCGITAFLIVAPAAILLARGYSFDLKAFRLIGTGIITIKTDPKGADIYLDGKKNKTTPAVLRLLLPKEYEVRLAKIGYRDWHKKITVHERMVTSISPGPEREIALLLKTIVQTTLSTAASDFQETELGIFFVEDEKIFRLELGQGQKTLLATTTLSQILKGPTSSSRNQFRLSANALWQNDRILVSNLPIFKQGEIITSSDNQIFLLLDRDLYQVTETLIKVSAGVSYASWIEDARILIYGNEHEIWIFDSLSSEKSRLITRSTKKLGRPVYNPRTSYVFVSEDREIKAIEVDSLGQPNIYTLTETIHDSIKLAVNAEGTHILYLDGQSLYTLKIR